MRRRLGLGWAVLGVCLFGCSPQTESPCELLPLDTLPLADVLPDSQVTDDTVAIDALLDVVPDLQTDLVAPADLTPADLLADITGEDLVEAPPTLLINELNCHGDDFIEVVNLSPTATADLSGVFLSDGDGASHRYTFRTGTQLGPMERVALFEVGVGGDGLPFGLACGLDEVRLSNAQGQLLDQVVLPLVMDGTTWSRLPDGSATWAAGTPTPEAPNLEAPNLEELLFSLTTVHTIALELPQESIDALWVDSATYVPATFQMEGDEATPEPMAVGVRIKGKYGSFRNLDGKSALKIKFNFAEKSNRFHGLKKLTLNNMVQDPSMIHEVLAYRLFSAMGVPCPRTGYAWVTLNGQPYGLYLVLEAYDDVAMSRHFATTQHVYEGEYGLDVIPSSVGMFEVDEGTVGDMTDLTLMANASFHAPDQSWMAEVAAFADVEEWLRMWAVEMYIGHWDGYAPTINNYYLHSDQQNIFSMMPNGADQTFGGGLAYHEGGGYLFQRCMQDVACRQRFDQILGQLSTLLLTLPLDNLAQQVWNLIAPYVEADPRKPYVYDDCLGTMQGTRSFMVYRSTELSLLTACWLGADSDADGDGFRCEQDCDEMDPNTHVGAYDTCGDMIDQDCNGLADDAFECPDCREVWRGPHLYFICTNARTQAEAALHCQEVGAELVVVNGPDESNFLGWALGQYGREDCWMGITDAAQEAVWLDWEGTPITWTAWGEGQPDNWGEVEHCAEFFAWGDWNDLHCEDVNPVACEVPCTQGQDEDGDGALRCDSDCDDGNSTVYPGAPEVCGDNLDNDCNGEVDAPGC